MPWWPLAVAGAAAGWAWVRARSRRARSIAEDHSWEQELRDLPGYGDEGDLFHEEEQPWTPAEEEPNQCFVLGNDGDAVDAPCDPFADPSLAPIQRFPAIPFASAPVDGVWPVESKLANRLTVSYWTANGPKGASGRSFGTLRETRDRDHWHTGIDLYANAGDVVRAPEAGTVIAILPFTGPTWAVYLRSIDGLRIYTLGEVGDKSWREFKAKPGSVVGKGAPLARVANQGDATMLHFEITAWPDQSQLSDGDIVEGIRDRALQWNEKDDPPPELRDPSAWAVFTAYRTRLAESGA